MPNNKVADSAREPVAIKSSAHRLSIRRSGCAVQITVSASNEYLAMELFDRFVKAADGGSLSLDLHASHRTEE